MLTLFDRLDFITGLRPTHRAQAHGATVTSHDSTRKSEKRTKEDSGRLAMSPADHCWAGPFFNYLLNPHKHIEFKNTFKITITSTARYPFHFNALRSGVLSPATIGPIRVNHPSQY
jgi:hypothetical protein